MISLKSLLDMIATEAAEAEHDSKMHKLPYKREETNLLPIIYRLELIREKDGAYHWVED